MNDKSASFDLSGLLAVVRRRRYIALAAGLAMLSAMVLAAYAWHRTYEADSTVFVDKGVLFHGSNVLAASMDDELRILKESITSRHIVDRVLKKLDLDITARNAMQYEALVNKVRKGLNVTVKGRGSDVDYFIISYQSSDPKQARDIVNALVNEYIEQNLATRRADLQDAYSFLSGQLQNYKQKLDDIDTRITGFEEKHPWTALRDGTLFADRLGALESEKLGAEVKLKVLAGRKSEIESELSGKKKLVADFGAQNGSPQARLNRLNNELMMLSTKYTDRYPEVVKVKSEIASIEREIERAGAGKGLTSTNPVFISARQDLARTNSELESLKTTLAAISRQEHAASTSLEGIPGQQQEWSKLRSERGVFQKLYDDTLQKLEDTRTSEEMEMGGGSTMLRVVDPAVLPAVPVKPDRVIFILAGLALGAAGGIGAALGMENLDNSYPSEEAVETGLKIPVLVSIARVTTEEDRIAERKKDRRIFGAAGVYIMIICVLLAREFLFRYMGIKIGSF